MEIKVSPSSSLLNGGKLTHQSIVDSMVLPRVLDQQNVKQQICVVTHVVPVSEAAVPEELREKRLRELRILPTAVLQQLQSILADVRILDEFLDVAESREIKTFNSCAIHIDKPRPIQQQLFSLLRQRQKLIVRNLRVDVNVRLEWNRCTGALTARRDVARSNQNRHALVELVEFRVLVLDGRSGPFV